MTRQTLWPKLDMYTEVDSWCNMGRAQCDHTSYSWCVRLEIYFVNVWLCVSIFCLTILSEETCSSKKTHFASKIAFSPSNLGHLAIPHIVNVLCKNAEKVVSRRKSLMLKPKKWYECGRIMGWIPHGHPSSSKHIMYKSWYICMYV